MARIAYVNGSYVSTANAYVHINDRGYQFADGVYEGISIRYNKLIDLEAHLDRLWRSMDELAIISPMGRRPMAIIFNEVMRRNRIRDGFIYVQVTRGVATRDHGFPDYAKPALIVTCRRLNFDAVRQRAASGVAASTQPDIRWGRCDIKSTALLPNILAKQAAREEGAFEAVLVDKEGFVTEGSSTNMWIVKAGHLITRSTSDNILSGITLARIKEIASELDITIEERAFSVTEAKEADEMFFTSSTNCTMPIVKLDDKKISDGTPGPVAKRLLDAYFDYTDN
ncbi:D-amino-acid transaminase [Kordiimonas aquimaris]|uniref:D-amino-acid transaminase n=1 Tax=Kordiimonas aquimaris TaxID=707591 RepID=UPI0021D03A3C|nr:D-amino-acid transaminase [Kordiimonas aquimaris]